MLYCKTQIFVKCSHVTSALNCPTISPPTAIATGRGPGPLWKHFFGSPSKGEPARNFYTKSERLSAAAWLGLGLICTFHTWWHLRERQWHMEHSRAPGICTSSHHPLSSALPTTKLLPFPDRLQFMSVRYRRQSTVYVQFLHCAPNYTNLRGTTTPNVCKSEHQTNICISTNLQGLSFIWTPWRLKIRALLSNEMLATIKPTRQCQIRNPKNSSDSRQSCTRCFSNLQWVGVRDF